MAEISHEWVAELKKGSIQLALLAVLSRERMYGFQIIGRLRDLSDGFYDLKEGTLYPALRRLEKRGFLSGEWVPREEGGAPRKYYTLTPRGRMALAEAAAVWKRMRDSFDSILKEGRP